jgi:hypothetical protein
MWSNASLVGGHLNHTISVNQFKNSTNLRHLPKKKDGDANNYSQSPTIKSNRIVASMQRTKKITETGLVLL